MDSSNVSTASLHDWGRCGISSATRDNATLLHHLGQPHIFCEHSHSMQIKPNIYTILPYALPSTRRRWAK